MHGDAVSPGAFPPIEPHTEDWLPVGDGHLLRYEESGNPRGLPVVALHGGPGSGCRPEQRRYFDPDAYRIVLFDQRGSGRSTPRGETRANTTAHLVEDLERLRAALGIVRWVLFGGSWGATLALAYAAAHRERVRGLILRGVFLAGRGEIEWYLRGVRAFLPQAWEAFAQAAGARSARGILDAYRRRVESPDAGERCAAAAAWRRYEDWVTEGRPPEAAPAPDEDAQVDRLRVQLHYLAHDGFVDGRRLLRAAARLGDVPGIIVQGERDLVCPPLTAWRLARAWPGAELELVAEAGHAASDPAIASALVRAARRMCEECRP